MPNAKSFFTLSDSPNTLAGAEALLKMLAKSSFITAASLLLNQSFGNTSYGGKLVSLFFLKKKKFTAQQDY